VTVDLWERIADALNKGFATIAERARIRNAMAAPNVDKVTDFPRDIQDLIRELESRPRPEYHPTRR
jgi:hypothetical protein